MPRPEVSASFQNPTNEFDLSGDFLGPNLRLRDQLSPEQREFFDRGSSVPLVTYYPYSTFGPQGIVAIGEIYADCYETFGLERINKISQLGGIALLPDEISVYPSSVLKIATPAMIVSTTRWGHSLTAAVVLELMLRNNAFSEREIKKGIASALLHDAAIFPFSDLAVIEARFNEDQNLPLYLEQIDGTKREDFEKKYGVVCSEIPKIARGKGILGSFLKIADRLAYTAYDSICFSIRLRERRKKSKRGENPLEEIVDIFESKPNLFDIFEEVKIDSQKGVCFENAQNLAAFLKVRALMSAHVYLNPERLKFQAVVRMLMSNLLAQGEVKIEKFIEMTDLEFIAKMGPLLQIGRRKSHENVGFLKFGSKKKFREFLVNASGLPKPSDFFWVEEVPGFDTLTHLLARDPRDGGIKSFRQVCPEEARILEELNRQTQGVVAYYLKEN